MLLRPLIGPGISDLAGRFLDTEVSRLLIKPFVRANGIDLSDYELDGIRTFNDFFRRKIRKGLRPVSMEPSDLIAPCDGRLKVYPIREGLVIPVKQSSFTVRGLLKDKYLAASMEGGFCLVFRLCVDDYHRYIWFDSGRKYKDRRIDGFFHTVRPAALEEYPVFVQNTREYSVIDTDGFGRCVQMEVGAMLVGRIVDHVKEPCPVKRGTEKGYFEFGASTIILLIPKDRVKIREDILRHTEDGGEYRVRMGEVIGGKDVLSQVRNKGRG